MDDLLSGIKNKQLELQQTVDCQRPCVGGEQTDAAAQQEQQAAVAEDAAQASKEIRDVRTRVDSKAVGAADKQLRDEWMRKD